MTCHGNLIFFSDFCIRGKPQDGQVGYTFGASFSFFSDEILAENNGMSGDATAATILARYSPMEPEMVLQLFAQQMPQWRIGTASRGTKKFVPPWITRQDIPSGVLKIIHTYTACKWRSNDMCLLEFPRKTSDKNDGNVAQWVERAYKEHLWAQALKAHNRSREQAHALSWFKEWVSKERQSVNDTRTCEGPRLLTVQQYLIQHIIDPRGSSPQAFYVYAYANKCPCNCEKAIGCQTRSRLSDEYYGQWMVLHIPFRSLDDFRTPELALIPAQHHNLAMCRFLSTTRLSTTGKAATRMQ